jgi:AmiR/NasT family two-component response regulator
MSASSFADDAGVLLVDQARIEAQLAQEGERLEDLEAVGVHVAQQSEDSLPLALELHVVDLAMPRGEVELEDLLLLGGKVRGHVFLRSAQHERPDASAEQG